MSHTGYLRERLVNAAIAPAAAALSVSPGALIYIVEQHGLRICEKPRGKQRVPTGVASTLRLTHERVGRPPRRVGMVRKHPRVLRCAVHMCECARSRAVSRR